jgi:hypothetical protein
MKIQFVWWGLPLRFGRVAMAKFSNYTSIYHWRFDIGPIEIRCWR